MLPLYTYTLKQKIFALNPLSMVYGSIEKTFRCGLRWRAVKNKQTKNLLRTNHLRNEFFRGRLLFRPYH